MQVRDMRIVCNEKTVAEFEIGEVSEDVLCIEHYGRRYAHCPHCRRELGAYYDEKIRAYTNCPYCGALIGFKE